MIGGFVEPNVQYRGFVNDLVAMIDTYALEVWKNDRLILRAPLHCFKIGPDPAKIADVIGFPSIEPSLNVDLVITDFPPNKDSKARVPFFVRDPASVHIQICDQWWEYQFAPSKSYRDRRLPRRAAPPGPQKTVPICEHQWDGERIPFGESGSVATCSRCGEAAVDLRLLGEQNPQRAGTPVRRETLEPTSTADSGTKGEEGA